MSGPRIDQRADGAVVSVRVQPRARRSGLSGLHGEAVKVALRAPPVDGAANAALTAFLADVCAVPGRTVRIVSGQTSRDKRVLFETLDADAVADRLAQAMAS
ncbi:MAG: DUF167 domain-containing protein [bacterium]